MLRLFLIITLLYTYLLSVEDEMGTVGFARVQTSFSDDKENVCFKLPGASTKYRLGNECESWIELGVYQELTFNNGIVVHNQVRPIFYGENEEKIDFLRFDEFYSEISGVFDNSVSFWIGRRFYKRYDSYLSDYFFLNMSGDGAGINNLDLGELKLSYSFIYDNINPSLVVGDESTLFHSHDIRLEKPVERGEYTLFLNYMYLEEKQFSDGQKIDSIDGFALGLIYKDTEIFKELFNMKGNNISGIFYGKGVAKGAGAYSPYRQEGLIDQIVTSTKSMKNSDTIRLINYNQLENDEWGIMSNLVYEYRNDKEFLNIKQDWFSAGIRPYWFFSRYSRLLAEIGYDSVHDRVNNDTYSLSKFSTALEFALDTGLWERPVVRFHYTTATWSDNAKGQVGTDYYSDKTSGDNIGIQIEYIW